MVGNRRGSHGKVKVRGEVVNVKEKLEEADEVGGDGEEDGGGVGVAACGDGKETVAWKDVGVSKGGRELVEGTADVVGENQTAAAVEY